jgi:putative transposase
VLFYQKTDWRQYMDTKNSRDYKSHWHCVYHLKYHLVFVTKYRRKCFTSDILDRLKQICIEQCSHWSVRCLEFGGEADHVHLLIEAHPNIMLSRFINSLKTVSSRLIRKEFSSHFSKYYWKPALWTRAYCIISAGGAPLSVLAEYIRKQEKPQN